jgi:two-component system sensor histidine kinase/response regulator
MEKKSNHFSRNRDEQLRLYTSLFLTAFLTIILIITFSLLNRFEKNVRKNAGNTINDILSSTHHSIKDVWITKYFDLTSYWAGNFLSEGKLEILYNELKNQPNPVSQEFQTEFRNYFTEKLEQHEDLGITIITPQYLNLISMHDQKTADTNLIALKYRKKLDRVFKGEVQFIPPVRSNVPLADKSGKLTDNYPTMFVVAPISDKGKVIAALSIRINPMGDFSAIAQTGRYGSTGETYLVDDSMKMISESRFTAELASFGLIETTDHSLLKIEIRNPKVNLSKKERTVLPKSDQPFTLAAQKLKLKENGISTDGYNDFRGVRVLGAWLWDEDLEIGFITEIDEKEIMQDYQNAQSLAFGLIILTSILTIFFVFTTWGITQRSNQKVLKSLEQFKALFENAAEAFLVLDTTGRVIDCNKTALNDLNMKDKSEIISLHPGQFSPDYQPNDQPSYSRANEMIAKSIQKGSFQFEWIHKKTNGETFPVEISLTQVSFGDNHRILAVWRNRTTQKKAEEQLKKNEEQYRTLIENIPGVVYRCGLTDPWNLYYISNEIINLSGYPPSDFTGINPVRLYGEIIHPDDREPISKEIQDAIDTHSPFLIEYRIIRKNGNICWVYEKGQANYDDEGNPVHLDGTIFDNTINKLNQEEVKKLSLAVEQSPTEIVITNPKGQIEYVNPKFCQITGYSKQEVLGKNPRILSTGRQDKNFYKDLWNTILAGKNWSGEFCNKKKNGEIFWEKAYISSLKDTYGNITHFVGIKEDITLRKKIEKEKREKQRQFETLINTIPGTVYRCLVNKNWTMEYINPEIEKLTGYPASDFINNRIRSFTSIIHPEDYNHVEETISKAIKENSPFTLEYRICHKNGTLKHVFEKGMAEYDNNGKPIFLDGTILDISERIRAEKTIKDSQLKLRTLLDNIEAAIFMKNLDGQYEVVNSFFEKTIGKKSKHIIGKTDWELFPENAKEFIEADNEIFKSSKPIVLEEDLIHPDGTKTSFLSTKAPLVFEGNVVGLCGVSFNITEQKIIQEKLRLSEQRVRNLYNNLHDTIIISIDRNFVIDYVSDTLESITGDKAEDKFGAKFGGLTNDTNRNKIQKIVSKLFNKISDFETLDFEVFVHKKHWHWFSGTFTTLKDIDGNVTNVLIHLQDIHDRIINKKKLEKAIGSLERSEQEMKELINNAPFAIAVSILEEGNETRIDTINQRFVEMFGYEYEEIPTVKDWLLKAYPEEEYHNYVLKNWTEHINKSIKFGKTTDSLETRVKCKNGEYRYAEWSSYIFQSKQIITALDVTQRKQAELDLNKERLQLKELLDSSPIGVAIAKMNSEIVFLNDSFKELFDVNSGDSIRTVYKNKTDRLRMIEQLKTTGRISNQHLKLHGKNKTIIDGLVSFSSINYNNEPSILGWAIDISELKKIEEQLKYAKESAESATHAKSEFLARMSHEIRTPMNAIIGLTYLTLQTNLSKKQREHLQKIQASGQSLLGIINDILDFSKIEAGKLELENAPFDLEKVFQDLANVVTNKAHEKGLELVIGLPSNLPLILIGDSLKLNQVLINLVNNAIKFTEKGEVVIQGKLVSKGEKNICIEFSVRDTGIGLTKKQKNKLFQSFTQADSTTTRKYGGTGLGLSISKSLVEMMDGEIWVESEYSVGSTFYFTANFALSDQQKDSTFIPSLDVRGINILLVDDNETSLSILAESLESFTFKVDTATSGDEAIELIRKNKDNPYKIMLLDWNMPKKNGIQVAEEIKTDASIKSPPTIIMVTAYNRDEVLKQVRKTDIVTLLTKPVNNSTLFTTIMEALGKKVSKKTFVTTGKQIPENIIKKLKNTIVLLVEDNEVNQDVAVGMFEAVGIRCEIAENGEEAVEMIMESGSPSKFSLVFMDLQMPVMDGYEATKKIREHEEFSELPIIAMTADAITGVSEKCIDAGMNDYIPKPIDPDFLFRTLLKWTGITEENLKINAAKKDTHEALDFPEIEGIDTAEGLQRINHNRELYIKLLNKFILNYEEFIPELNTRLRENNIEEAERMVHTLKGVSGNIGALAIFELASHLNSKLGNHDIKDFGIDIGELERLLTTTIGKLKKLKILQESGGIIDSTDKLSSDKFKNELMELKKLIQESDFDSLKKAEELLSKAPDDLKTGELKKVYEYLIGYNFSEAEEQMEALFKSI